MIVFVLTVFQMLAEKRMIRLNLFSVLGQFECVCVCVAERCMRVCLLLCVAVCVTSSALLELCFFNICILTTLQHHPG